MDNLQLLIVSERLLCGFQRRFRQIRLREYSAHVTRLVHLVEKKLAHLFYKTISNDIIPPQNLYNVTRSEIIILTLCISQSKDR